MRQHADDDVIWALKDFPDKSWKYYMVEIPASDETDIIYFSIDAIQKSGLITGFDNLVLQNGTCQRNGWLYTNFFCFMSIYLIL